MPDSIFVRDGDRYVPTALAGSPWTSEAIHGGPAAGLLARAVEQATPAADLMVARLTMDLFRQVPSAPLTVTTKMIREGRRIASCEASLWAGDVEVSRASGLYLQQVEIDVPDDMLPRKMPAKTPDQLPTRNLHGEGPRFPGPEGFHTYIQAKHPGEGSPFMAGGGMIWLNFPCQFIAGEETSPLVRVAAISDFANPLTMVRLDSGVGFINTDITIYLHRQAESEWIGIEAHGAVQRNGIGVANGTLFDERGPIGIVAQAKLANRRLPGAPAST
ncbi:hypothetical protein AYO38_11135 [bacterium SCGC AG-212-C10]|nr:hypothetical protein AYO38_11135 [bacterium SCGC AG-212-C10]